MMSERLFTLSRGAHQRSKLWEKRSLTLKEVDELFEIHVSRADKDGPAIVAGTIMGAERKAVAVERLSFLIFDVDGTQSLDTVLDLVDKTGKYAIVYTTYSHLKTTDWVKTDSYVKWAARKKQPEKHTTESVLAYLKDNDKGYLTNVTVSTGVEHTPEGVAIKVTHDPVHKVRIVFPLARDWVMADSGGYTTNDHIKAWKQTYAGVGEAIGLDYDRACLDPSRLHFLPAHKEGAVNVTKFFRDRPLLDYADYKKASIEAIKSSPSATALSPEGAVATYGEAGASYNGVAMDAWVNDRGHGIGHRLLEVIADNDPNPNDPRIRGDRGSDKDGVHIQCPFEDEHSTIGGMGTFFDPGPPDNYDRIPIIRCMHSHCQGRRTEDFLTKMLIDGWFTYDQLTVHVKKMTELYRNDLQMQIRMELRDYENAATISTEELVRVNSDVTPEQAVVVETLSGYVDNGLLLPQAFLDELAGVRYLDSFNRVFNTAAAKGQLLDEPAVRMYALGISMIGMPGLRLYYRENASKLLVRYHDFTALIVKLREKIKPFTAAIDELVLKHLVNQERRDAIKHIADYYGRAPRDVLVSVRESEQQSGSITQQELQARTEALFGHYVVYSDKTQLWFLDPTTEDADGQRLNRIFTRSVLAQRYANVFYEYQTDQGKKRIDLFDWWIKNRRDVKYLEEVAFRPDKPPNDAPNAMLQLYNLYEGFNAVKSVRGDASPFYDHILNAWCGGDVVKANWVVTWFADIIQNPGNRPASALVIHGGQGTGKSILFDHCLSKIMAPYAVTSNRRDDITGRFNTILKTTLLFVAEEAVFAGDPQAAAKIKSYVSSDTFTLEAKGTDTTTAKLFSRFAFLTNDFHAMRMDGDDRRYCVVETSDMYKQKTEYFQKLREWFENGGNEIVFNYLQTWKPEAVGMTWASLYTAPSDASKVRQQRLSQGIVAQIAMDVLVLGEMRSRNPNDNLEFEWPLDDEFIIPRTKFVEVLEVLCGSLGSRRLSARTELELRLAMSGGYPDIALVPRQTKKIGTGRAETCLVFPPRRICLHRAYQLGFISYDDCASTVDEDPKAVDRVDLTSHLRGKIDKLQSTSLTTTIEDLEDASVA